jgi:hypothetical protein
VSRRRHLQGGHDGGDLRAALADLPPKGRDLLRRVLIGDDADRDVIASALLRYRDAAGDELADIIDSLTMYPDARRKVVRMLAEIDAVQWSAWTSAHR